MSSMYVQAALTVLLLFVASVATLPGGVTFWREEFTMTCPGNGIWYNKANNNITAEKSVEYKAIYGNDKKGLYHCTYDSSTYDSDTYDSGENIKETYYFYVQGKVCANCFELDGTLFAVAIVGDVVMTGFLMSLIYWYTKKKNSAAFTHTSKAPARPGGRGPPVPSPDYEQLQPSTLSQGTYSSVNRMG